MYQLKLFVTGQSERSERAIANARQFAAELGEPCQLEIIDILENPAEAEAANIITTPTLIQIDVANSPRITGDLSDTRVLRGLIRFQQTETSNKDLSD